MTSLADVLDMERYCLYAVVAVADFPPMVMRTEKMRIE